MKTHLTCLLIVLLGYFCFVGPASADEVEGGELVALAMSIDAMPQGTLDEYDALNLKAEIASWAMHVAWLADDQPAIEKLRIQLTVYSKQATEIEDDYIRDQARAFICLGIAASGDAPGAERKARAIRLKVYQVYALGLIAAQRARAGDTEGFVRLANESMATLKDALALDKVKPEGMEEYPSWVAWIIVDQWVREAFYSGLMQPAVAKAELNRLAKGFAEMAIEPGAKAEVLGTFACGLAVLGDKASALALVQQADAAIAEEVRMFNALGPDDEDWTYGPDPGRLELARVYLKLSDEAGAKQVVRAIEGSEMQAMMQAIMGSHLLAAGQEVNGKVQMNLAMLHMQTIDREVKSQQKNRTDDWIYDETSAFWNTYYVALDISRSGDAALQKEFYESLSTEVSQIAFKIAQTRAKYQPLVMPAK